MRARSLYTSGAGATSACSGSRNLAPQSQRLVQSHDVESRGNVNKNMNKYATEQLSQAIVATHVYTADELLDTEEATARLSSSSS